MLNAEQIKKIYATPKILTRREKRPNEHDEEYINYVLGVWDKTR